MSSQINSLYHQVQAGDKPSESRLFELLLDRFRLIAIQRIWNRQDAEDIVQKALMKVISGYRTIEIRTSFTAWALTVLEYQFQSYLQTKKRQKGREAEPELIDVESDYAPPDPSLKRRLLDCLKLIGRGNRRYARILNLHHQGFSKDEVCERLKMSLEQSYVVLSRSRSLLRDCLNEEDAKNE